jgi:hypothetical protein
MSEWTVDTLREHLEAQLSAEQRMTRQRFNDIRALLQERYDTQTKALDAAFVAAEKAVQTALASAEKAVTKAETSAERRFESVNEFRQTLTDQAATFMPRAEAEQRVAALAEKLDSMAARLDKTEGHSGGTASSRAILVAAVMVVGVLVSIFFALKGG